MPRQLSYETRIRIALAGTSGFLFACSIFDLSMSDYTGGLFEMGLAIVALFFATTMIWHGRFKNE